MYGFDAAVWVVLVVIIVFEFVSFIQGNEKGKRITFIEHYCVPGTLHARVQSCLFETLWTVTRQAPLSMGFSRPEFWSGLPISSSRGSFQPGNRPSLPAKQSDCLPAEHWGRPIRHTALRILPRNSFKVIL